MAAKLYLWGICMKVSKLLQFLKNTFAGLSCHILILL